MGMWGRSVDRSIVWPIENMVGTVDDLIGTDMLCAVRRSAIIPFVALALTACSSQEQMGSGLVSSVAQETSAHRTSAAVPGQSTTSNTEYRLGPGDKIRLRVDSSEELTDTFDVTGDGSVSLPLVGKISAVGLTLAQFEQRLKDKLRTYIKNPDVSVQIDNYRPFYILGEVKKGGEFPYSNGLVVRDAVAKAGGYTYRAVTSYVYIRHAHQQSERRYSLNAPVRVMPGDNIRVPERIF